LIYFGVAAAQEANNSNALLDDNELAVDHRLWSDLLTRHVVQQAGQGNRFDYGALAQRSADLEQLDAYLAYLSALSIGELNRDQQLAYWLNLHNAAIVKLIAERYPVSSLADIERSDPEIWATGRLEIDGERHSVNSIRELLLSGWPGPMVHYGLVCGANSCPAMLIEPFDGARVQSQLEVSARSFINSNGVTASSRGITVAQLFRTHAADFGASEGSILAHLRGYSDPKLADAINNFRSIKRYRFDARLNASN